MKLYLFTRNDNTDWDEYHGAVIAATSHQEAKQIMLDIANENWKCILIAESAEPEIKEGLVLASYSNG